MNAYPQDFCEVKKLFNFFDAAMFAILFAQLLIRGVKLMFFCLSLIRMVARDPALEDPHGGLLSGLIQAAAHH